MPAGSASEDSGRLRLLIKTTTGVLRKQSRQINAIEEKFAVLLRVLETSGIVRSLDFDIKLHQHRFRVAQLAHPCNFTNSLTTVVDKPELVHGIAELLGYSATRAISIVAKSFRDATNVMTPHVDEFFPRRLCVFGGYDDNGTLISGERLSAGGDSWEPLPNMSQPRKGAAAVKRGEEAYVCGGHDGTETLNTVERFNAATWLWWGVLPMTQKRDGPVVANIAGQLMVFGGHGDQVVGEHEAPHILRSGERFDDNTLTWQSLRRMAQRRAGATSAVLNDELYMCGGTDGLGTVLNAVSKFNPQTEAWEAVAPMLTNRWNASAAVIDGSLYVCGGRDSFASGLSATATLNSVERFMPATGVWEAITPMLERRSGAVAVAVAGRIHVCGGHDGRNCLRTVERYDPSSKTWERMASMRHCRSSASGVALRF